jgi:hypothetical protein
MTSTPAHLITSQNTAPTKNHIRRGQPEDAVAATVPIAATAATTPTLR